MCNHNPLSQIRKRIKDVNKSFQDIYGIERELKSNISQEKGVSSASNSQLRSSPNVRIDNSIPKSLKEEQETNKLSTQISPENFPQSPESQASNSTKESESLNLGSPYMDPQISNKDKDSNSSRKDKEYSRSRSRSKERSPCRASTTYTDRIEKSRSRKTETRDDR